MTEWTKQSNGHTLTVVMDEESLLKKIDEKILKFRNYQKYGYSEEEKMNMTIVYGDWESDFHDPQSCINDLMGMKQRIMSLKNDKSGIQIWNLVSLKKNGTFKKTTKPILRKESFGPYFEDSYGWYVEVLRMEPINDTKIEIVLTDITIHH